MTRKREPVQTCDYTELTMNGVTVPIRNLSAKISPIEEPPAKLFPSSYSFTVRLEDKASDGLRAVLAALPPPPDSVDAVVSGLSWAGLPISRVIRICCHEPPEVVGWRRDLWGFQHEVIGFGMLVEGPRMADGRWSPKE